jgi:Ca2+-binding RTX toxin-like protein
MATAIFYDRVDGIPFDAARWAKLVITSANDTSFVGHVSDDPARTVAFIGVGLTYSPNGTLSGGVVTRIYEMVGDLRYDIFHLTVPATALVAWGVGAATETAYESFFAGDDFLTASRFDDRLEGLAGHDLLAGSQGDDTIDGGDGFDMADHWDSVAACFVDLAAGSASDGHGGQDTLISIEGARGTGFADTMLGDGLNNVFRGQGGDDVLFGGAWDGSSPSGDDVLEGDDGDDALWGLDGADRLIGSGGDDILTGGAGGDTLDGGSGQDLLFGGTPGTPDPVFAHDTLRGGAGDDGLWGGSGSNLLQGDEGNDYIQGGALGDQIDGGLDNDVLLGGAGSDTITGYRGFDYLYGGADQDTFRFNYGDGYDVIWDFSAADHEVLEFGPGLFAPPDLIVTMVYPPAEVPNPLTSHLSFFMFEGDEYSLLVFPASGDQLLIKGLGSDDWDETLIFQGLDGATTIMFGPSGGITEFPVIGWLGWSPNVDTVLV